MQIRKHKDYRVNKLAEFIEHLQDAKYHIKPFEMAENIVLKMATAGLPESASRFRG